MRARKRVLLVGAIVAGVAIGGAMIGREPARKALEDALGFADEESAARCEGSLVELEFDPEGHIEARADGETVAAADVTSRDVNDDACTKTPAPRAFNQGGVRYTTLKTRATVTCRFPGRFVVHVYSVSPSWAGERPAGSAVGLVLGRRITRNPGPQRTILASATVVERSEESVVSFVGRFCTPS
jgi:hypothetical protein